MVIYWPPLQALNSWKYLGGHSSTQMELSGRSSFSSQLLQTDPTPPHAAWHSSHPLSQAGGRNLGLGEITCQKKFHTNMLYNLKQRSPLYKIFTFTVPVDGKVLALLTLAPTAPLPAHPAAGETGSTVTAGSPVTRLTPRVACWEKL